MTGGTDSRPRIAVAVPHAGLLIPPEVEPETLSSDFDRLIRNVDWFTDALYDFRDLAGGLLVRFPYCSLILEANRHPDRLDESVPLADVHGRSIYRTGREPDLEQRRRMADTYLVPFHRRLGDAIEAGADFLLDAHSTVTARGVAAGQIELMNAQHSPLDPGPRRFCPNDYIEIYAEELRRRLPEVRVTVNASDYMNVYGHICAAHSVDARGRVGRRAPAILQETNDSLYLRPDGSPDIAALERLRRAFAAALAAMLGRAGPAA